MEFIKNVNALNDALIGKGQEVSDLDAKINAAVLDDSFDADSFKALKAKRDSAAAQRDAIKDQLEEERANQVAASLNNGKPNKLTDNEKSVEDQFLTNLKGMMTGNAKIMNEVTSSTDADGHAIGLTIPQDLQTAIHTLVRQYASLQPYVNVESTSMSSGSRVYEKWTDVTPLADLDDETATIGDNDDPNLALVKYVIHRYAGITTITDTLLKDTAENLLAWLTSWISKKVVVTRNKAILGALDKATITSTITTFDDVKDLVLTKLDPAIKTTAFFITNTSGFAKLAKVKNAMGGYLLGRDPSQPDVRTIEGKPVIEIADRWLANDADGNMPLFFGDYKQYATLFDREQMSLLSTNIGGGAFENDSTKIRVIDRFDVEITDNEAIVKATFKNIADQPGNLVAASATTTTPASK
nr:phage major capsid protein [Secundilactobacillus angelensis]